MHRILNVDFATIFRNAETRDFVDDQVAWDS